MMFCIPIDALIFDTISLINENDKLVLNVSESYNNI